MVAPLYTTDSGLLFHAGKIVILTIGLPARGKTHISRALERYLRWMGIKTLVVSLGDYRRKILGGAQKVPPDYFSPGEKSPETIALRKKVSDGCEKLIWDYFDNGGQVVIYDANNGRKETREELARKFEDKRIHVVMLESLCDNRDIIEANIRSVKISSPDYRNWDPDQAVQDYYNRIKNHEQYYETIDPEDTTWPFIKILNVGEKITLNGIQGYLQSRIVFFLMNIHNRFRTIYFARSGQSLIEHSYKADSDLSPAGWEYAERLKDYVLERRAKSLEARGLSPTERKLVIWTSTRRRAHHTAWPFVAAATGGAQSMPIPQVFLDSGEMVTSPVMDEFEEAVEDESDVVTPPGVPPPPAPTPQNTVDASSMSPPPPGHHLPSVPLDNSSAQRDGDRSSTPASMKPRKPSPPLPAKIKVVEKPQMLEINPGIWDGLSPEQAKKYYPLDWKRFTKDPYSYRAPRAESYHDLSVRLEPILIELEREQEDLLIIGHASVIRCLLAYLIGLPPAEIPAIEIARGDLLEVVPTSYGVHSHAFHFWDGPGRSHTTGDPSGSNGTTGARRRAAKAAAGQEGLPEGEDDEDDEGLEGAGGGGGVWGHEVEYPSAGNSDTYRDANNFYENYAEDTKGKRKVVGMETESMLTSEVGTPSSERGVEVEL